MNIINVDISFEKQTCITTGKTLITGDYNSTKLIFNFDKSEGRKVFEMISPDNKLVFSDEIQNNEVILTRNDAENNSCSIFNKEGYYTFEVSLYGENSKLTSMYGRLYVEKEKVNIDGELVEVYLPIFDKLLKNVEKSLKEMESAKEKVVIANEEAKNIINDFNNNVDDTINKINKIHDDTAVIVIDIDNKLTEYNKNASEKLSVYNTNAETKKSEFNTNVAYQTKVYNDNAKDKLDLYNQNDTTKTTDFNSNANSKTETYNNNHDEKLNTYNTNVANKTTEFNTNATNKKTEFNTNADTKLQEYNTNADNKIAEYDLHSQELNNKIIATRNELERVKNDVLETGTDTDTYIHLEDSAMAEYQELSVDGVCEQETTQGYQLFNKDNIVSNLSYCTATLSDGILTVTPTATGNPKLEIELSLEAGYYTLNNTKKISDATQIINGSDSVIANLGKAYSYKNFATNENSQKIRFNWDNPNNTTPFTVDLNELHIVKGTYTSSTMPPLEPYTGGQPSPSPEYKQPISTIENSLKITSCNKNIINNNFESQNKYGVSLKYENGKIKIIGKSTSSINFSFDYIFPKNILKNNVNYTFSNTSNLIQTNLQALNSSGNWLSNLAILIPNVNKTKTFLNLYQQNQNNIRIQFIIPADADLNEEFNIQLEEGTTAPPFEEHLETQITANLPDGEFIGKINDKYKDTLKVEYNEDDGQYHLNLYKSIGRKIYNSDDISIINNEYSSISYARMNKPNNYLYYNDYNLDENIISTNAISKGVSWTVDDINEVGKINAGFNDKEFWVGFNYGTTEEQMKTKLNNTEVYYRLKTPYVVDLGIVDMPITYNKITNLFTDSDLMPQINAKYYRNFISTIQNLQVNEKALKQELVDINNRLSALESASTNVASESEVIE